MESNTNEESLENFSKLTYRQRFAITEYGYLLSPENAEVVGKMLGNFRQKDVLPFCQANGKKVSGPEEITPADVTQISTAKPMLGVHPGIVIALGIGLLSVLTGPFVHSEWNDQIINPLVVIAFGGLLGGLGGWQIDKYNTISTPKWEIWLAIVGSILGSLIGFFIYAASVG